MRYKRERDFGRIDLGGKMCTYTWKIGRYAVTFMLHISLSLQQVISTIL